MTTVHFTDDSQLIAQTDGVKKPRRKRGEPKPEIPTEHAEQAAFVGMVKKQYQHDETFLPMLFFSVPNGLWVGGGNKFGLINKFKAEGFRTGVADVIYMQARGIYSGLTIEMKRSDKRGVKNGGMSDDQMEFQAQARKAGHAAVVCYNADEAFTVFQNYMKLSPRFEVTNEKEE